MDEVEKIEYYLNKDHHKNVFFNPGIPPAWEFPGYHFDLKANASGEIDKPGYNNFKLNNLGYRSNFDYTVESLAGKQIILCLGDSDTFGRSIQYDDLWTTKITNTFPDYIVMNMGIPGAGADTMTRIASNMFSALGDSIKIVLAPWAMYSRREFVTKKFQMLVYQTPTGEEEILPFPDYWDYIDWKSNSYNFYKNKRFLEALVKANHSELYDLEINPDTPVIKNDFIAKAKSHGRSLGVNTHTAIANYFEKCIKKEPSLFQKMRP